MKKIKIAKEFFEKNRENFTGKLLPNSLSIFHSSDIFPRNGDQSFRFRQQSDLFYLTGIDPEKTILLLYPDCPNPDLREVLFLIESNE